MAVSALDITDTNPWSRLTLSEFSSVHALRDIMRRQLQASRALVARASQTKPSRAVIRGSTYVNDAVRGA